MLLTRNRVLLAKIEASSGSDASPTVSADEILCFFPVEFSIDPEMIDRRDTAGFSAQKQAMGRKKMTFRITCYLKGSGAAGTPPEIDPLLRACGYAVTNTPATKDEYKPRSTGFETVTIYYYDDGNVYKGVGFAGDFSINMVAGQPTEITFNLQGKYLSHAAAAVPSATYDTTEAIQAASSGITYGAYDPVVRSLTFNSGNTIIDRMDLNSSEGIKATQIQGRNPTLSANIEAVTETTKAFWANWIARTPEAVDAHLTGSAGNIIDFAWPAVCASRITPGTDGDIRMFTLDSQALETVALNDNVTITFK